MKLPLLDHNYAAPSAFTPEGLVSAVRAERRLEATPVPAICVLEFDGDLTDWLVTNGVAWPFQPWACFHTTMFALEVEGTICGIIPRTIGGPYAVLVAEQLAVSGAKVILGLTSAGRISSSLPVPSLVVGTEAIRDEGTSFHYLSPSETVFARSDLATILAEDLLPLGLPVVSGLLWTTDAPYRETQGEIEEHARDGAFAVEMQASSLFAFAAARHVAVGVVAHVTNGADHSGEQFDKGPYPQGRTILEAMCRSGLRWLRETA